MQESLSQTLPAPTARATESRQTGKEAMRSFEKINAKKNNWTEKGKSWLADLWNKLTVKPQEVLEAVKKSPEQKSDLITNQKEKEVQRILPLIDPSPEVKTKYNNLVRNGKEEPAFEWRNHYSAIMGQYADQNKTWPELNEEIRGEIVWKELWQKKIQPYAQNNCLDILSLINKVAKDGIISRANPDESSDLAWRRKGRKGFNMQLLQVYTECNSNDPNYFAYIIARMYHETLHIEIENLRETGESELISPSNNCLSKTGEGDFWAEKYVWSQEAELFSRLTEKQIGRKWEDVETQYMKRYNFYPN
ncbi:MAG: hypothetical protein Q7U68_07670 [Candidatus Roizmanbacteria bacterium]|nr:hypothetical protein [Candidatus Roizmanbacteria bacterium]